MIMNVFIPLTISDCAYTGYILESSVVARATHSENKEECSRQCKRLDLCQTFAYSPSVYQAK